MPSLRNGTEITSRASLSTPRSGTKTVPTQSVGTRVPGRQAFNLKNQEVIPDLFPNVKGVRPSCKFIRGAW